MWGSLTGFGRVLGILDTCVHQVLKQVTRNPAVQMPFQIGATLKRRTLASQLLMSCQAEAGMGCSASGLGLLYSGLLSDHLKS